MNAIPMVSTQRSALAKALAGAVLLLACAPAAASEEATLPAGALVCTTIEPAIEHARIVRETSSAGIRPFVEAQVEAGACRVVKAEEEVLVVDVDQRGFVLIEDDELQWWTDAENVWGYFETAAKLSEWKKR